MKNYEYLQLKQSMGFFETPKYKVLRIVTKATFIFSAHFIAQQAFCVIAAIHVLLS